MDIAIKRAMDGFPRDVDVRESQLAIDRRPADRGRVSAAKAHRGGMLCRGCGRRMSGNLGSVGGLHDKQA